MSIKKRPWNRINLPVYSVSTTDENGKCNMNICTYATQISMHPKRFAVAVYPNTKTFENIQTSSRFLLQILSTDNIHQARLLGKQSGLKIDKHRRLTHLLSIHQGLYFLNNVLGFVELEVEEWKNVGDHFLALCNVISYKNVAPGENLSLYNLRQSGIVSV